MGSKPLLRKARAGVVEASDSGVDLRAAEEEIARRNRNEERLGTSKILEGITRLTLSSVKEVEKRKPGIAPNPETVAASSRVPKSSK